MVLSSFIHSTVHEYNQCMKKAVDGQCDIDAQSLVEETVVTALKQSIGYCRTLGDIPTSNCMKRYSPANSHETSNLNDDYNGAEQSLASIIIVVFQLLLVFLLSWHIWRKIFHCQLLPRIQKNKKFVMQNSLGNVQWNCIRKILFVSCENGAKNCKIMSKFSCSLGTFERNFHCQNLPRIREDKNFKIFWCETCWEIIDRTATGNYCSLLIKIEFGNQNRLLWKPCCFFAVLRCLKVTSKDKYCQKIPKKTKVRKLDANVPRKYSAELAS